MGRNVTQKILDAHLLEGRLEPGEEIGIRIDHALTQDATGTMAYLQFEAMGIGRVHTELAVSYVDHNTIQVGPENADDHAYLRSAAARFGAVFSKAGNGICHQLHLERFGRPGGTLLGADSHTPTAGGLGMLGIGAGGLDVAAAMGGAPFYLACPRVVRVTLRGGLRPWVTAKDVILEVLRKLSTKGNVGLVLEYGGPALRRLDVPERATIANMGAECGVTASVFPSDAVTLAFLRAQGRAEAWTEWKADPDAAYDREECLDLSRLEPLAAEPHSPGRVRRVAELAGMPVDQVLIGSCTNSSYRDLKTVARILEGRRAAARVDLGIAPGSRQVMRMLAREGWIEKLLGAGARLLENACGFCIGNSLSPGSEAVSLRTSNRNFEGRSGTPSARVYLVSPAVAALAALEGCIVDPERMRAEDFPRVRAPARYDVDDAMFEMPPADGSAVKLVKGPNIGEVPRGAPLPETLKGTVAIKVADRITTDHIMPAGARLKYRSNVAVYASFVFEGVDPGFAGRAAANRDRGKANIVVAGESYGQGSSREHAALCPMYLGVKAVLAKSFERIHEANLINFGILPLRFGEASQYEEVSEGDTLVLEDARRFVEGTAEGFLANASNGVRIAVRLAATPRQRAILLAGGRLNRAAGAANRKRADREEGAQDAEKQG